MGDFWTNGLLDERIISHNLDAQVYEPEETFDIVYSVSVLEHMPASVRRAIIAKLPLWLAPGGRIYLSLDLIPGTHKNLWPLSEGREVDEDGHPWNAGGLPGGNPCCRACASSS